MMTFLGLLLGLGKGYCIPICSEVSWQNETGKCLWFLACPSLAFHVFQVHFMFFRCTLSASFGPSPSWEKKGPGIYCMRSLRIIWTRYTIRKLSVHLWGLPLACPIFEDSDKTEVRLGGLGSSWIIPQPLKEKQWFSVKAVDFVKMGLWLILTVFWA